MSAALKVAAAVIALGAVTAVGIVSLPKYRAWSVSEEYRSRLLVALRDPSSAQLRHEKFVVNNSGTALCGNVNARNAFGGYVGYTDFVVTKDAVLLAPTADVGTDAKAMQERIDFLLVLRGRCFTDAEKAAAGLAPDSTATTP